MRMPRMAFLACLGAALALAGTTAADTTVELKGVHLCCGACVKGVADIVKKVDGTTAKCDRPNKTVTITAPDDATAQKLLDELAAGGYHGETGNDNLKIKDDSGVAKGKVATLTLTGIHNCCGQCTNAIKKAAKKAEGVNENSLKAKEETFTLTGDFDAAEVVKALNAAGFHVKMKQ